MLKEEKKSLPKVLEVLEKQDLITAELAEIEEIKQEIALRKKSIKKRKELETALQQQKDEKELTGVIKDQKKIYMKLLT